MKKILCLLLLSLFTVHFSFAQNLNDLEAFEQGMKPGTVLTYDVTNGTKRHQLVVTIKKWGDVIAFDWKTTEPDNKSGSVEADAGAVGKADALFTAFDGGATKLSNESCLFISHKVYDEVAANTQASVKLLGASDTATLLSNTISEYSFMLNGNFVSVPGWELQGGGEIKCTIGSVESPKFPLIVKFEYGWTLVLAEVKTP